ncbi:hypothetical protein Btru_032801 [Bulinus truncatus]|nr:hypothetical protein Btru_032801 [Bulinus truncatus]
MDTYSALDRQQVHSESQVNPRRFLDRSLSETAVEVSSERDPSVLQASYHLQSCGTLFVRHRANGVYFHRSGFPSSASKHPRNPAKPLSPYHYCTSVLTNRARLPTVFSPLDGTCDDFLSELSDSVNQIGDISSIDANCNLHPLTDCQEEGDTFVASLCKAVESLGSCDGHSASHFRSDDSLYMSPRIQRFSPEPPQDSNINHFYTSKNQGSRPPKPWSNDGGSISGPQLPQIRKSPNTHCSPTLVFSKTSLQGNNSESRSAKEDRAPKEKKPLYKQDCLLNISSKDSCSTLNHSLNTDSFAMTTNSAGSPSSQVFPKPNIADTAINGQAVVVAAPSSLPKPKSLSNFALCNTSPQVIDHQSWLLSSIPSERYSGTYGTRGYGLRDSSKINVGGSSLAFSSSDGDSRSAKAKWNADEIFRARKKVAGGVKKKEPQSLDVKKRHQNANGVLSGGGHPFIGVDEAELGKQSLRTQKSNAGAPMIDPPGIINKSFQPKGVAERDLKNKKHQPVTGAFSADSATGDSQKSQEPTELWARKTPLHFCNVLVDSYTQTKTNPPNDEKAIESPECPLKPCIKPTHSFESKTKSDTANLRGRFEARKFKAAPSAKQQWNQRGSLFKGESANRLKKVTNLPSAATAGEKRDKSVKKVKKKKPRNAKKDKEPIGHNLQSLSESSDMSDTSSPIHYKHRFSSVSTNESSSSDALFISCSFLNQDGTSSAFEPMPASNRALKECLDEKLPPRLADTRRAAEEQPGKDDPVAKKPGRKKKKKPLNQSKVKARKSETAESHDSGTRIFASEKSQTKQRTSDNLQGGSSRVDEKLSPTRKLSAHPISSATRSHAQADRSKKALPPRSNKPPEKKSHSATNRIREKRPHQAIRVASSSASVRDKDKCSTRRVDKRSPSVTKVKPAPATQSHKRNAPSLTVINAKKPSESEKRGRDSEKGAAAQTSSKNDASDAKTHKSKDAGNCPSLSSANTHLMLLYFPKGPHVEPPSTSDKSQTVDCPVRASPHEPHTSSPLKYSRRSESPKASKTHGATSVQASERKSYASHTKAKLEIKKRLSTRSSSRGQDADLSKAPVRKLAYTRTTEFTESTSTCSTACTQEREQAVMKKKTSSVSIMKMSDQSSQEERQDLAGGDQGMGSGGVSSSFTSVRSLTNVKLEQFKAIWRRQNSKRVSAMSTSGVYISSNSYIIPLRNLAWNSSTDRPSFADEPSKEPEPHGQRLDYGLIFFMLFIQIILHYFVSSQ